MTAVFFAVATFYRNKFGQTIKLSKEKDKFHYLVKLVLTKNNDPGEIRTHDPRFRRPLLYPAELPDQRVMRVPHRNINHYREKFC